MSPSLTSADLNHSTSSLRTSTAQSHNKIFNQRVESVNKSPSHPGGVVLPIGESETHLLESVTATSASLAETLRLSRWRKASTEASMIENVTMTSYGGIAVTSSIMADSTVKASETAANALPNDKAVSLEANEAVNDTEITRQLVKAQTKQAKTEAEREEAEALEQEVSSKDDCSHLTLTLTLALT